MSIKIGINGFGRIGRYVGVLRHATPWVIFHRGNPSAARAPA